MFPFGFRSLSERRLPNGFAIPQSAATKGDISALSRSDRRDSRGMFSGKAAEGPRGGVAVSEAACKSYTPGRMAAVSS